MENALDDAIISAVGAHYRCSTSPFLLAHLGLLLRKQGLWPHSQHPGQNLRGYIESEFRGTLKIVRDPLSPARIAVTDQEHLKVVTDSFLVPDMQTGRAVEIANLPRTVLLAFCVNGNPDQAIFLKKTPPHFFRTQRPSDEELNTFWEIPPRFRVPNLRLTDPRKLSISDRTKLESNILSWCTEAGVSLTELLKGHPPVRSSSLNALQRLIEAQSEEIRRTLLIPADIAILLSERQ